MRVPTGQLQQGFGADAQGIVPYPVKSIELQAEAESFYGRRGVIPCWGNHREENRRPSGTLSGGRTLPCSARPGWTT